jgi:hypothetical protein
MRSPARSSGVASLLLTRAHLRSSLARFDGQGEVAFAVEGCTGWRYVVEELTRIGIGAHLASRRRRLPSVAASAAPRPTGLTLATCWSCW